MRYTNKYKYISKSKDLVRLSRRVLKFKRPKWNSSKKYLFKKRLPRKVININKQNILRGWEKIKKVYKNKINLNRYLLIRYSNDKRKRFKLLRNTFMTKKDRINTIFFKSFFQIDFFLYSLYISTSSQESQKFIQSRKISKNNKLGFFDPYLKLGDLISFNSDSYNFNLIREKCNFGEGLNSYYEYDYYSQNFIVLKNFENVNKKDVYLTRNRFF